MDGAWRHLFNWLHYALPALGWGGGGGGLW